jgi:hemerythrin-like metal-binding protein
MPLLVWNDSLSVKITEFDEEHKVLVKMINDLHDVIVFNNDFDMIAKTLKSLVKYAQTHFKNEEEFMKKHNYPHLEAHQEEHKRFVVKITIMMCITALNDSVDDKKFMEQLVGFHHKYHKGMNTAAAYVQDYVGSWIINHVKKADAHYGALLHDKAKLG